MKGDNEKRKWYFLIAVALIVGAMIGYFATNRLSTTGEARAALRASAESKDLFTLKEANAIITCRNQETTKMDLSCLEKQIGEPINQIRRRWWWILIGNPCDCGDGRMTYCLSCTCCLLIR